MTSFVGQIVFYSVLAIGITLVFKGNISIGDDLIVREIQFFTFVVCITVAICTAIIISKQK